MARICLSGSNTVDATIEFDGSQFTISLQKPTVYDRLEDDGHFFNLVRNNDTYANAYKDRAAAQLKRVVGWKDLFDENGQPVPFNAANLSAVLADPKILVQVSNAVSKLYSDSQSVGEPAASPSGSHPDGTSEAGNQPSVNTYV